MASARCNCRFVINLNIQNSLIQSYDNAVFSFVFFFLKIENHPMTIIASDSGKVRPTTINTLYTLAGERYDFIVHANQQRRGET